MNTEKYLQRIGLENISSDPTHSDLANLQLQHLLYVPFENLDIHLGREITLDLRSFYKKIVTNHRGGFCYELNGLFNELLKDIGFTTKIVSARVASNEGGFGEDYDHLAIVAEISGDEYLVDVGFGDFVSEPLRIEKEIEQQDANGIFKISDYEEGYLKVSKKAKDRWNDEYIFKNVERDLQEFDGMCVHNQTSPESHFTKGKLCSLMTKSGRKTLTDKVFISTNKGEKEKTEVSSEAEFDGILKMEFGISRLRLD